LGNLVRCTWRRASIRADENDEDLIFYSNWHTYITTAKSNGVDGPTLQNLGGHTKSAMKVRYTHPASRTMNTAARIAEALRPKRPSQNEQASNNKPAEPPDDQ
jgi:hypothetical protein